MELLHWLQLQLKQEFITGNLQREGCYFALQCGGEAVFSFADSLFCFSVKLWFSTKKNDILAQASNHLEMLIE